MIEAFTHGIPTVAFSDLDAIPDLYHEKAMILVDERTDEALANGIETTLATEWENNMIKKYAQNFSFEKMAKEYINVYEKIINEY